MRVNELALSQALLPSLAKAGIGQLAEHDPTVLGSLFTFNHVIEALVAVIVCLEGALAVIHVRKRRLEKLLERLDRQDGE